MRGLMGTKIGMTRVFDGEGCQVPVTVLEVGPCVVLQRKTRETDGYEAVQCGFGEQTERRTKKPQLGHFKKASTTPKRRIHEFHVDPDEDLKVSDVITASIFEDVTFVDVTAKSKGRGFQGVVRRHGMAGGRKTHGAHSKRGPGSIGCSAYPARVIKGKRLPGHMGHRRVTTQNLKIVQIMLEDNLVLVRGAVPGPVGAPLVITKAVKKRGAAVS